jgi:hypothetical protein
MEHPDEPNRYEEMAFLDISQVDFSRAPAGIFASYHVYPYYPDYISQDPRYQVFSDYLGQNSYVGYLTALKAHYQRFPLLIAEFGSPSSWGNAHFAHNGIHHGGHSELEQGEQGIRMLQNIHDVGTAGGIYFAWIDEWFKRTWVADPLDFDTDRRFLWHNLMSAEQNFGLLGFQLEGDIMRDWETFCVDCPIRSVRAGTDFAFFHLDISLGQSLAVLDTIWIALDTYDAALGESLLPGGQTLQHRAEFLLMITAYKAELYVTEAYDTYAIWHGTSVLQQQYRSVVSDGAPWRIVRWRNNTAAEEVQYVGSLQVNRLGLPPSSKDAVTITDRRIQIRLPWMLLNFTDPGTLRVLHDDRSTPQREVRVTDGISAGIFFRGSRAETTSRFLWEPWTNVLAASEYPKKSFAVMAENLRFLPGNPVGMADNYVFSESNVLVVDRAEGVLGNDRSFDGSSMSAVLERSPSHGMLNLRPDGSFIYMPDETWPGTDMFRYRVRAGINWSEPINVTLSGDFKPAGEGFTSLYPNPATGPFTVQSTTVIDRIELFSVMGQRVHTQQVGATTAQIDPSFLAAGVYFVRIWSGRESLLRKVVIVR